MTNNIKIILYYIVAIALLIFSIYSGYRFIQEFSMNSADPKVTVPRPVTAVAPSKSKVVTSSSSVPQAQALVSRESANGLLNAIGDEMTQTALYLANKNDYKRTLDSAREKANDAIEKMFVKLPQQGDMLKQKITQARYDVDTESSDYYTILSSKYANNIVASIKNTIFNSCKSNADQKAAKEFRHKLNTRKYVYLERSLIAHRIASGQPFDKSEQGKWIRKAKRLEGTPLELRLTSTGTSAPSEINLDRMEIIESDKSGAPSVDLKQWLSHYEMAISHLEPLFAHKGREKPNVSSVSNKRAKPVAVPVLSSEIQSKTSRNWLQYLLYSIASLIASWLFFRSARQLQSSKVLTGTRGSGLINSFFKKKKSGESKKEKKKKKESKKKKKKLFDEDQDHDIVIEYEEKEDTKKKEKLNKKSAGKKQIIKEPYIIGNNKQDVTKVVKEEIFEATEKIDLESRVIPAEEVEQEIVSKVEIGIEDKFHINPKETKNVKPTEVVLDKDNDIRNELKRIISTNDESKIYEFLSKTIKDSNRAKDLFLANMSHEIRTPLNGIVGFTELLKSTKLNNNQKEFVDVIENSSDNLLVIVNDILDLSKIKAGKLELENIAFNSREKFESTVESYAAQALQKHIKLNLFIDPELPAIIVGDPTKISQILTNLISNAIKFTNDYGEVNLTIKTISNTNDRTKIRFTISDNGIGISEDKIKHIFDDFIQEKASTNREFGGTGLGLAIASKLVNLMGGELQVKSSPGKGTKFYFDANFEVSHSVVNAENERFVNAELSEPRFEANAVFKGKKALIIEDNIINQKLTDKVLTALGFDVTLANNGLEGVNQRKSADFDVILMDIQMPVMDGITATKEIIRYEKENHQHHVPIVAVTANATRGDREKYLAVGMDEYIPKPIGVDKIKNTLMDIMESRDLHFAPVQAPTSHAPMEKQVSASVKNMEPPRETLSPLGNERVLICKKSPLLRSVYAKIIEKQGYIVDTASDEEEFLSCMYQHKYKFVFVDEEMSSKNSKLIATNLIQEFGAIPMALDKSKNYTNDELKQMLQYENKK